MVVLDRTRLSLECYLRSLSHLLRNLVAHTLRHRALVRACCILLLNVYQLLETVLYAGKLLLLRADNVVLLLDLLLQIGDKRGFNISVV